MAHSRQDGSVGDVEEGVVSPSANTLPVRCEYFVELLYMHHVAYQSKDWAELMDNRAKFRLLPENPHEASWDVGVIPENGEASSLLADQAAAGSGLSDAKKPTDCLQALIEELESGLKENRPVTESDWQSAKKEHLSVLRFVWSHDDLAETIHLIMRYISPQVSLKLLHALCVRLPVSDLGRRKWYHDAKKPVKLVFAGLEDKGALEAVASSVPTKPNRWWPSYWFHEPFMREVAIFYTEVDHIFGRRLAAGNDKLCLGYVNFTQALTRGSDKYDDHFATPIGQAITSQNWELAFPHFVLQRSGDLCFQLLLSWYLAPISQGAPADATENEKAHALWVWPRQWQLVCITLFGLRGFAHIVFEFAACLKFLRDPKRDSIPAGYFNPYTLFCLGVELFTAVYVVVLTLQHWTPPSVEEEFFTQSDPMNALYPLYPIRGRLSGDPKTVESVLYNHPGMLATLIFAKWVQLMLSIMNSTLLLPKLLPAWTAITSAESLVFLVYLIILSCGTMMSYYSLPSDLGPGPGGYLTALYRMFRLDFFADFDDDELQGLPLTLDKPNKSSYELVEADRENVKMHMSMKGFTMMYSLLFPVIIINMYIGVLSDTYQKCLAHNAHVCGLYMSQVTCRLLLYRHFGSLLVRQYCPCCACLLPDLWCRCLNCFGWFGDDCGYWSQGGNSESADMDAKGVFIVLPVDFLPTNEFNDGLLEKFKDMEKTLRGLQNGMQAPPSQLDNSPQPTAGRPSSWRLRQSSTGYFSLAEDW